jgi:hypothetical protein
MLCSIIICNAKQHKSYTAISKEGFGDSVWLPAAVIQVLMEPVLAVKMQVYDGAALAQYSAQSKTFHGRTASRLMLQHSVVSQHKCLVPSSTIHVTQETWATHGRVQMG